MVKIRSLWFDMKHIRCSWFSPGNMGHEVPPWWWKRFHIIFEFKHTYILRFRMVSGLIRSLQIFGGGVSGVPGYCFLSSFAWGRALHFKISHELLTGTCWNFAGLYIRHQKLCVQNFKMVALVLCILQTGISKFCEKINFFNKI